ncbi:MAG: hypothetical protein DCC55_20565, partial [Chloroflexi bacterium]
MASVHSYQRRRPGRFWPDGEQQLVRRRGPETAQADLVASPWFLTFVIFVLAPVMALRLVGLYYTEFEPHTGSLHPYEAAYRRYMLDFNTLRGFALSVPMPWPQYARGQLGWYRQGLREVAKHRALIEQLAPDQELGTLVAAAVANQGNSYQRPFGWAGLEKLQTWLGRHFDWPWPQWERGYKRWEAWFEQSSVGIGQITPQEVEWLGYPPDRINLLVDPISIALMLEKLAVVRHQAEQLGLGRSDAMILMLIAGNTDGDLIQLYSTYGRNMEEFLAHNEWARRQLAKMMTYIAYLHTAEQWPLPQGIDWYYILSMAEV